MILSQQEIMKSTHGHAVSRIIAGDLDELSGLEGVSPKAKIAFYSATPDSIIPNLQHSVRQSKLETQINIRLANISFSEVNMVNKFRVKVIFAI